MLTPSWAPASTLVASEPHAAVVRLAAWAARVTRAACISAGEPRGPRGRPDTVDGAVEAPARGAARWAEAGVGCAGKQQHVQDVLSEPEEPIRDNFFTGRRLLAAPVAVRSLTKLESARRVSAAGLRTRRVCVLGEKTELTARACICVVGLCVGA